MPFDTTTAEVAGHLRMARNTLIRLRAADVLRPGEHFIAIGAGLQKPKLRWDLNAVEMTLARRSKQVKPPAREAGR